MALDLKRIQQSEENLIAKNKGKFSRLLQLTQGLNTISSKEKQFFVQNLQVMTKSGLPLDRSLKTLALQMSNKKFKRIITSLYQDTEKGVAFQDSLGKFKSTFGELFINMVEAGSISGKLDEVLGQIYLQIKKGNELKSRIKSAMTYPVIVLIAMVLIGIGMLIFVIPKITSLFDQVSADLPVATKLLINTSDFIISHGLLSAALALAVIISFIAFIRSKKGKYIFHGLILRLPICGPIVCKINIAKFARTLSSLIKTDIPIIKTFEVASKTLNNRHYRQALVESAKKLKEGGTIANALSEYPRLFPPVIIQMIMTGEETGQVDSILAELASFYEDEIDQIMKTLPSIIEPVLMLILGAGVAIMAIAIIMPMYSLTQKF
ncbi:MAG TPA: hypothetical protein DEB69_03095 [Candidatus Komeilibacteria bacterium]|nr:hypothetical protein [Candidatus Komeilibacteria bacterium]